MAINTYRAARRTGEGFGKERTPDTVGPGTYSNTHNELAPLPGETAVPFWSLQEKNLNQNKGASALTPGPGAYASKPTKTSRDGIGVGHIPFRSRMARMGPTAPGSSTYMSSSIEKNPGPGTYTVPATDVALKPEKDLVKPVKPVLGKAPEKSTPSIPIRRLLPGSQPEAAVEDSDAEMTALVMRHTGEPRDMVGPGEYEPDGRRLVGHTPRTTNFYASKMSRGLFEPSVKKENTFADRDNPGPGTYDVKGEMAPLKEEPDVEVNTYQFSSRSALSHQKKVPDDRISPGPGRYENIGYIDRMVQHAKDRSAQLGDRTQFGSMTMRIGWQRGLEQPFTDAYNVTHVPGPGHYDSVGSSFPDEAQRKEAEKALPNSHKKKFHGVHHPNLIVALQEMTGPLQAFNSTDDRACNKPVEQITPSPDEYNIHEARAKSLDSDLRERAKVGRKGAFGTCAERFFRSPLEGKSGLPDPGTEHPEEKSGAHAEPRSVFQSQTPRFTTTGGNPEVNAARGVKLLETPAPGSYDIEKIPNYRSPYRTPRQDHLSFGSCKERYGGGQHQDVFVPLEGHVTNRGNPGPGEYTDGLIRRQHVRGAANLKADRPKQYVGCAPETVGPGSYSPTETTLLKKTFNVTTQAPVGGSLRSARGVAKGSTTSRSTH